MEAHIGIDIILASVREQRAGEKVARWTLGVTEKHSELDVTLIDLKDYSLPPYHHAGQPADIEDAYTDALEVKWRDTITAADGFIIVTPEYNWGYPGQLKNALDYLYAPWNKKPVAFVSYGGLAAGTRSVEQLRQIAIALQMAPIRGAVHIPFVAKAFDESGQPTNPATTKQAESMIAQLIWWAKALKAARDKSSM